MYDRISRRRRFSEKAYQSIQLCSEIVRSGRGRIGNAGELTFPRSGTIPPISPRRRLRCHSNINDGPTVPRHLANLFQYLRIGLMMGLSPMMRWSPHDPQISLMLITTSKRHTHMSILQNGSTASHLLRSRNLLFISLRTLCCLLCLDTDKGGSKYLATACREGDYPGPYGRSLSRTARSGGAAC